MKIGRASSFVFCVLVAGPVLRWGINSFSVYGPIKGHTASLKAPIPAYTRSLRPNYPYSIIPGGAYSAAELRYADQEDPVVEDHYADFDMKNTRVVQLTADRYQYVSYRLKSKVYWTKRRLRIPKGEVLLTDGASFARSRCGNRLSDNPHQAISKEEPPAKALSVPPMQLGTPMELAETPPLGELSTIAPVDAGRFPPVVPPSGISVPAGLPPLGPVTPLIPVTPIMPVGPPIFGPPGPPAAPPSNPPTSPTPPVVRPIPPVIPPENPPLTPVPEPKAVYLFLVTFVLSLYGLTRMVPGQEKTERTTIEEESH
jgi:hypothetical protein